MDDCRLDGARVRALREKKRLTQVELSKRLNRRLSDNRIRVIELAGKSAKTEAGKPVNVRVSNAKALAEELGVTLDDICLQEENNELPVWLSSLTDGFVGRDFVFKELREFLAQHDRGYFTLVGDPGEGKSAIAAQVVTGNHLKDFAPNLRQVYHFNSRARSVTTTDQCFANLHQLLAAQGEHSLPSVPSEAKEYANHWVKLVELVGSKLKSPMLFVIDALDEVTLAEQSDGANVLSLPQNLPTGVYFFVTRRRERMPCHFLTPQYELDLQNHIDECEKDVVNYIRNRMKSFDYMSRLKSPDLDERGFVERLAKLSDRNFMYLHLVMGDIEDGKYESLEIEELPIGLVGYYERHWERMGMLKSPVPRDKLRVIYGLANLESPASVSFLASTYKLSAITVQEILDETRGFLTRTVVDGSPRFSFYHASFLDFLKRKDIVQAAGDALDEAENDLADHFLSLLRGKSS